VLGFISLRMLIPIHRNRQYFLRFWKLIYLVLFFLYELFASSIRVAYAVLFPFVKTRPGIVAMPLDVNTDAEITLTANLISLTPGTLSIDVSENRKILYVHCMFIENPQDAKKELKDGMEKVVIEALR
jgi:multicomponent Na+:H+ antiporter subunit E